jgi:UPF0755 protein
MSFIKLVCGFILFFLVLFGGSWAFVDRWLNGPGPLEQAKTVVVPRGAGRDRMAEIFVKEGVVAKPLAFKIAYLIDSTPRSIKAGEYEVPPHVSVTGLLEILQSGKTVQRRLTVPEGLSTAEIVELVRNAEALDGEISIPVSEGELLPETYFYSRGDTRNQVLERMREAMTKAVDEAWRGRANNLPLASKRDLVVLASMVEKETGQAAERARVAAVFVNRIRARMPMESDPTVIYGIAGGRPLGRELSRADLQRPTPYNTYARPGLPAGPIANPGRAALMAAARPQQTQGRREYYFVADGSGGHAFASTLVDHNRNVARWRELQRQRQDRERGGTGVTGPGVPAPAEPPPGPQSQ